MIDHYQHVPPSAHQFAADLKYRGVPRQESWSRWVQRTALRPGMDAKDWYAIYDAVEPAEYRPFRAKPSGAPTHRILHAGPNGFWREVVVLKQHPTHIEYYWPAGDCWGSDPVAGLAMIEAI